MRKIVAATLLLLFAGAGGAAAAVPTVPAASPAHSLTSADLDAFFGGLVPYAIARADIPGAVIVVVHDGHVVFSHGYGYADVKARTPVSPSDTLFRIGSISKLFTWTSVMQLVQAGKLNLDADVNQYLDFRIPERFGKITLRNLMTHTPGFEDTVQGIWATKSSELVPLRTYLSQHVPAEIFAPGTVVAYSNYGATLAGYIVQRVSGEPFDEYVQRHIFGPLHMTDTTFVQPLPPRMRPMMATGYLDAAKNKTLPFELVEVAPAGSVSATADDMAKFMMAQLGNGSYNGARILNPATARLMHSRAFTLIPGLLNGFDLGFYQENRNGHQIIGHGGDTIVFHSDLHLILDADTGVFMSFNSAGKAGAAEAVRTEIFRKFLDRYYPYAPPAEATVANPKRDAARVAGYYISSRRVETALRLLSRLGEATVTAHPDGTITVSELTKLSGAPIVWREVGPLDYREDGGQTHLRFATDARGNVTFFATDDFIPVMVFQRVTGMNSEGTIKTFGGIALVVFLLSILIWLGSWLARAYFHQPMQTAPAQARLRLASRWGAIAYLVLVVAWVKVLQSSASNPLSIFNMNGSLTLLYILGVLALLGTLAMIAYAAMRVARGPGGVLSRAGELIVGLAAVYGLWALIVYGLVNFSYHY